MLIPRHTIQLCALVGQGCDFVCMCSTMDCFISGEFGVVYQATLNGWEGNYMENVAVKTLKGYTLSKLCSLTCNGDKEWQ